MASSSPGNYPRLRSWRRKAETPRRSKNSCAAPPNSSSKRTNRLSKSKNLQTQFGRSPRLCPSPLASRRHRPSPGLTDVSLPPKDPVEIPVFSAFWGRQWWDQLVLARLRASWGPSFSDRGGLANGERLRQKNKRLNCLLILGVALTVPIGVNEQTPRSDFELCPICTAKVPFSLAMHMVAAHSSNAIETSAETPNVNLRNVQASAHRQSQSKPPWRSKRLNHTRRGFVRNRVQRRH